MLEKEGRCVVLMCLAAFCRAWCFTARWRRCTARRPGFPWGILPSSKAYYLLVVALELPLGAAAARLGYKRMFACAARFFLSKLVFWRAGSFGAFLAERVMLAFVGAGLSGCDTAYLYVAAGPKRAQRALGLYGAAGMAGLFGGHGGLYSVFFCRLPAGRRWHHGGCLRPGGSVHAGAACGAHAGRGQGRVFRTDIAACGAACAPRRAMP